MNVLNQTNNSMVNEFFFLSFVCNLELSSINKYINKSAIKEMKTEQLFSKEFSRLILEIFFFH